MNDDQTPAEPNESDDRDERVAALLEVAPLDDLTRRRLVQRALAEAVPAHANRRARRLRAVAAVIAVVVIGGATAVVVRGADDDGETAAPTTEAVPEAAGGADQEQSEDSSAEQDALTPASASLGQLAGPADLRQRLALLDETATSEERSTANEGFAAPDPACVGTLDEAGAAPAELVATATYAGVPALVVVERGREQAFVLDIADPGCRLLDVVPLV
jgi:hypothetical protein